ncbi:hypothetical protein HZA41_02110 [Candidatus Peregrinibacteria bacterium]|nr:hypothetical protein [Candidatus Peregrinibacteria bacterium]
MSTAPSENGLLPRIATIFTSSKSSSIIPLWFFGILLLFGLLLIPLLTFAAENDSEDCIDFTQNSLSSSASFFQKTAENISGKISDTDLNDLFSAKQGKAPGEDLYILIHEQFNNRPYTEAVKLTAQRFNYPEEDVKKVLTGAVSPLMLDSGRQLTVTEATERLATFNDSFQEEVSRQHDILSVKMDLVPIEIFANDDVSDSGFDLITDLDRIEDILFGLSTVDRMNFSYANTTSSLDDFSQNGNSSDAGVPRSDSKEGADSHACTESGNLTDIVNSALGSGDSTADSSTSIPSGYTNLNGLDITFSKPSNWTGSVSVCKSAFCLEISMENQARTVFPDDENCVACHVGSINDNLNDTLRQNLLPSKITGNLFESPTCKKASADQMPPAFLKETAGGLITITKKPISTPIDDDIVTKLDFEKSWKELLTHPAVSTLSMKESALLFNDTQRYFEFCDETLTAEQKVASGCTESLADTLTKLALTNAPQGSTYQDTLIEIEKLQDQQVQSAQKQAHRARSETRTKIKSAFYQYLKPEIDQMQAFFDTFFSLIKDIQDGPAKNLAEKKEVE